jgi:hypothetical protein
MMHWWAMSASCMLVTRNFNSFTTAVQCTETQTFNSLSLLVYSVLIPIADWTDYGWRRTVCTYIWETSCICSYKDIIYWPTTDFWPRVTKNTPRGCTSNVLSVKMKLPSTLRVSTDPRELCATIQLATVDWDRHVQTLRKKRCGVITPYSRLLRTSLW